MVPQVFIPIILILLFFIFYCYLFYPKQSMPVGEFVEVISPDYKKYHNDCLHPCIRFIPSGFAGYNWWMIQSPYYNRNNKIENPILYYSKDKTFPLNWEFKSLICDTPIKGFNSDPSLFYEENKLWIFWRECLTPLCEKLKVSMATVGYSTVDGVNFSELKVYLTQKGKNYDMEQCPILIKRKNKYLFYAAYYQYEPVRKNLGLAIWEGNSLDKPDFSIKKTIPFESILTCDKFKQLRISNHFIFIPKPLKHDLWHFDLFEYKNKLYMFSVAEWGDNIMLSISDDYENFKTIAKPLVNTHYSEQYTGYRQYYYKPTGYIDNDILYLYYTSVGKDNTQNNELYFTKGKIKFK